VEYEKLRAAVSNKGAPGGPQCWQAHIVLV
jgi:hypothetical protein